MYNTTYTLCLLSRWKPTSLIIRSERGVATTDLLIRTVSSGGGTMAVSPMASPERVAIVEGPRDPYNIIMKRAADVYKTELTQTLGVVEGPKWTPWRQPLGRVDCANQQNHNKHERLLQTAVQTELYKIKTLRTHQIASAHANVTWGDKESPLSTCSPCVLIRKPPQTHDHTHSSLTSRVWLCRFSVHLVSVTSEVSSWYLLDWFMTIYSTILQVSRTFHACTPHRNEKYAIHDV